MKMRYIDRSGNLYTVEVRRRRNGYCIYLDGDFWATADTRRDVDFELRQIEQKFDIVKHFAKEVIKN